MKQWHRISLLCGMVGGSLLHGQTSIASALSTAVRSYAESVPEKFAHPLPTTVDAALQGAFLDAGIVFTGEVTAIDRAPGTVTVQWHVEQGIKGTSTSTTFSQREWSGLWSADDARYVVGQRALVLLREPSVAGYTAPVTDGIIPLRGTVDRNTVDLRWIAQHVAVTDVARLAPMRALQAEKGSFARAAALQSSNSARAGVSETLSNTGASQAAAQVIVSGVNAHVDGSMVLDMMHTWQRTSGATQ